MFQSAYQDGDSVEVFSPAGKDPAVKWNLVGKVGRLYDKGVKGYVLAVSGGATSKMQIPKAPKGTLGLRQRHLVIQVMTAASPDKSFSLELAVTDTGGTRRRLVLSSSFRSLHCTPLHAQIPLPGLEQHRGCWANLSVDLAGLTSMCFRADAFRALDLLSLGPTCRVRKIFTMRGALDDQDTQDESGASAAAIRHQESGGMGLGIVNSIAVEPLPLRMAFPGGVNPPPRNWILSPSTLRAFAKRHDEPRSQAPARLIPTARPSPAFSRSSRATTPATEEKERHGSQRSRDLAGKGTPSSRRPPSCVIATTIPSTFSDRGTPSTSRSERRGVREKLFSSPASTHDKNAAKASVLLSSSQASPPATPVRSSSHSSRLRSPSYSTSPSGVAGQTPRNERGAVRPSGRERRIGCAGVSTPGSDVTVARGVVDFTPPASLKTPVHSREAEAAAEDIAPFSDVIVRGRVGTVCFSSKEDGGAKSSAGIHNCYDTDLPARRRVAAAQITSVAAATTTEPARNGTSFVDDMTRNIVRPDKKSLPLNGGRQMVEHDGEDGGGAAGWALDACRKWLASDGKKWNGEEREEMTDGEGWSAGDVAGYAGRISEAKREAVPAWSFGDRKRQEHRSDDDGVNDEASTSFTILEEARSRPFSQNSNRSQFVPSAEERSVGYLSSSPQSTTTRMRTDLRCVSSPIQTTATLAACVDDTATALDDLGNGEHFSPVPCMPQAAAGSEGEIGEKSSTLVSEILQTRTGTFTPGHLFDSALLPPTRQKECGERGRGEGGGIGAKDGSASSASAPKPRPGRDSALSSTATVPARQVIFPSARVDVLHTLLAASPSTVGGEYGRRSVPEVGSEITRAAENREKSEAEKTIRGEGESDQVGKLAAMDWLISEEATAATMSPAEREEGLRRGEMQCDETVTDALEHLVLSVEGVGMDGSLAKCTSTAGGVDEDRTRHDDDPCGDGRAPSRASADGPMVLEDRHRILFCGDKEQTNKHTELDDNLLRNTRRENVSPSSTLKSSRTSFLSPDLLMSKKRTHEITPVSHHAGASSPSSSIGIGRGRTCPGVTDDLLSPSAVASAGRTRDSDGSSGKVNNSEGSGALLAATSSYGVGDSDEGEGLALALNPAATRRHGTYWEDRSNAKRFGEGADDGEMERDIARQRSAAEELEKGELALVDLESSYRFEFGPVELSQSPGETRYSHSLPTSSVRSHQVSPTPAPLLATTENTGHEVAHRSAVTADSNSRSTSLHFDDDDAAPDSHVIGQQSRLGGRAPTNPPPPFGFSGGVPSGDDGDGDDDSIVFGSTAEGVGCSGSSTEDLLGPELPFKSVHCVSEGRTPGRRKEVDRPRQSEKQKLFFDPVLNCYYDKALGKYYRLP